MISCRESWPRRQNLVISLRPGDKATMNGVTALRFTPPPKIPSAKILWKSSRPDFFLDKDGIVLIDYLPECQTINAEYYSSLLVQLKDILKEKRRGNFTKGVLFCTTMPSLTGHLPPRINWPTWASNVLIAHRIDLAPSDYHLFPGLKNNWNVAIFRPMRRSLLPRRPGWSDKLLIFFFLSGVQS